VEFYHLLSGDCQGDILQNVPNDARRHWTFR